MQLTKQQENQLREDIVNNILKNYFFIQEHEDDEVNYLSDDVIFHSEKEAMQYLITILQKKYA